MAMKRKTQYQNSVATKGRQGLSAPAGFTLIEILVSLGIGTFGILAFSFAILSIMKSGEEMKTNVSRSEIAQMLRRSVLDRRALALTVQNNPVLKAVVTNDFTGPVSSVNSGEIYGIDVFDSSMTRIAGASSDNTHPAANPVYYTLDGAICTNLGLHPCYISVTASFSIQGHSRLGTFHGLEPTTTYPAWDPHLRPDFLTIHYQITLDSSAPGIARKPIRSSTLFSIDDLGI